MISPVGRAGAKADLGLGSSDSPTRGQQRWSRIPQLRQRSRRPEGRLISDWTDHDRLRSQADGPSRYSLGSTRAFVRVWPSPAQEGPEVENAACQVPPSVRTYQFKDVL